jgi:hypothetical protein
VGEYHWRGSGLLFLFSFFFGRGELVRKLSPPISPGRTAEALCRFFQVINIVDFPHFVHGGYLMPNIKTDGHGIFKMIETREHCRDAVRRDSYSSLSWN